MYQIVLDGDGTSLAIMKDDELYGKVYDIKELEVFLDWLSKHAAEDGGFVFGQIYSFDMEKLLFQIVEEEGKPVKIKYVRDDGSLASMD